MKGTPQLDILAQCKTMVFCSIVKYFSLKYSNNFNNIDYFF